MGERRKIGLRDVRGLEPGATIWDGSVTGFGARRQRDSIAYFIKYRTADGRQRWHTIGRHGAPWTPDMARVEALKLLGQVVKGHDPAAEKQIRRAALTVGELCQHYLADAEAGRVLVRGGRPKKSGTLAGDRGRIACHIIPALGRMPVAAVTRQDVERFLHAVAAGETARPPGRVVRQHGGKGVANRTIALLGAIFTYAIDRNLRADNPAHRLRTFAEHPRERRLSDEEYAALGAGLRDAQSTIWPPAIACIRFLALTGWRSGEARALNWRDIDLALRTATLPDTKTGRSMRPLSRSACDVLRSQPRLGPDALVFPATRGNGTLIALTKYARRIVNQSGLKTDITAHVLRHSFASLAGDMGYSEPTIASLVGHTGRSVTSRYVHHADAVLLAAADAVAAETARRMGDDGPIVLLPRAADVA
jgi:integrase